MAARKSKQRSPGKQPSLSLDDKRWQTLIMAHHTRSEQLIGKRFSTHASGQLIEALRSGKLRCMCESRTNPSERKWVLASFWQNLNIHVEPDLGLIKIERRRSDQPVSQRDLGQIYDWVFYVWKPDFDKLWPPMKADRQTAKMSHRRKPGLPPTYEWPLVVAAELIRKAKVGERDPTAVEMIDHCETMFADKFSPGLKEMQVLLKKLLFGQF